MLLMKKMLIKRERQKIDKTWLTVLEKIISQIILNFGAKFAQKWYL